MKRPGLLVTFLFISIVASVTSFSQCPKIPGTLSVSESLSVKAIEITVSEYAAFLVANDYDTTLFPGSNFLERSSYKELFQEMHKKRQDKYIKIKSGKGPYTFHYGRVQGDREQSRKVKGWLKMPMGGLSQTQAELYCKWLEGYYNRMNELHNSLCRYELRLPSKSELAVALQIKGVRADSSMMDQDTYRFIVLTHKR